MVRKHLTMDIIAVCHGTEVTFSACIICSNKLCNTKYALSIVVYLINRTLPSLPSLPPQATDAAVAFELTEDTT